MFGGINKEIPEMIWKRSVLLLASQEQDVLLLLRFLNRSNSFIDGLWKYLKICRKMAEHPGPDSLVSFSFFQLNEVGTPWAHRRVLC